MWSSIHLPLGSTVAAQSQVFQLGCITFRDGYNLISAILNEALTAQEQVVVERLLQIEPREGFKATNSACACQELQGRLGRLKLAQTSEPPQPICG
ncbi:hypothetical protein [Almyronema epifaneia]|uniref:Uncharacterized protein n=1 Tax=Almyronema epifaneia S1 TaxID=2991925 RepID=A0ABW6IBI4_9CYAN